MPYSIKKHTEDGKKCYSVITTETGTVHSKCTTLAKAKAQLRILNATLEKTEPKKSSGMTWKTYYGDAIKGKKFGSRQEVNDFMRETAKKFKELKK